MSIIAEKLWETVRTLPKAMLAEILNFAEILVSNHGPATAAPSMDLSSALE